jgi:hypothetical protein
MIKGKKMNIKTNRKILEEAIEKGCRTVADLANFLKIQSVQKVI